MSEALRRKELRQALYDEGAVVMADCLLTLHGDAHRDRRRLENRLFRREVFETWERDLLGHTIATTLTPFVRAGRADLVVLGYRLAMNLTAHVAGIDHDGSDPAATEALYAIVKKFSEGATLVHSTRDKDEVRAEVLATMANFDDVLLRPAVARRRALLERAARGEIAEADVPADVLTTLLRNQDRLDLPDDVVRREIAFYLQAGAHSTANALTHTLDHVFAWGADHADDLALARRDVGFVQRCVHESLRLDPASPVAWRRALAPLDVAGGAGGAPVTVGEGTLVVLDLLAANRDPAVWGPTGAVFDPHRRPPDGVPAWGLSFGGGQHACIGQELDGGIPPTGVDDGTPAQRAPRLFGTVAVMAHAVLTAGGRPDPDHPAVLDPASTRRHFSTYPILFTTPAVPA